MDENKFEIIQQLMDELKKEMKYSPDDIGERLGRKKPDVEIMKVEGEMPMEGAMDPDKDRDDDSMGSMDDMDMMSDSPGDKLKKRLMRLRG